jgi:hypothetical protein
MRPSDVPLLALLVPSTKQEDELIPLLAKIDAVAFPLMDAQLTYAVTHRFDIAQMPEFQALQPSGDLLLRALVSQTPQPC